MGAEVLNIESLHVSVDDTEIIKGLSLSINIGETHAIMGRNGSGKSTTAKEVSSTAEKVGDIARTQESTLSKSTVSA